MKKLLNITIILLLSMLLLTSCATTEKTYDEIPEWAIGTWIHEEADYNLYYDISSDGITYVTKGDKDSDYGYYGFDAVILNDYEIEYYGVKDLTNTFTDSEIVISYSFEDYSITNRIEKVGENEIIFKDTVDYLSNGESDYAEMTYTRTEEVLPVLPTAFPAKFLWESTNVWQYMTDSEYLELIVEPSEMYLMDVGYDYIYEMSSFNFYHQGYYLEENMTDTSYEVKFMIFDEAYNETPGSFKVEKRGENLLVNFIVPGYIELVDYEFVPVFYNTEA